MYCSDILCSKSLTIAVAFYFLGYLVEDLIEGLYFNGDISDKLFSAICAGLAACSLMVRFS